MPNNNIVPPMMTGTLHARQAIAKANEAAGGKQPIPTTGPVFEALRKGLTPPNEQSSAVLTGDEARALVTAFREDVFVTSAERALARQLSASPLASAEAKQVLSSLVNQRSQ